MPTGLNRVDVEVEGWGSRARRKRAADSLNLQMRVVERGRNKGAVRVTASTKGWNGRKATAVLHTLRNELQRFPTGRGLSERGERGGEGERREGRGLLTVGW